MSKFRVISIHQLAFVSACLASALSIQSAQAATLGFEDGTYSLAESNGGAAVDTLGVTVSGGYAFFYLRGTDNASFTTEVQDAPTGYSQDRTGIYDPYYYIPGHLIAASWNTATYPYLIFYPASDGGGFGVAQNASATVGVYLNLYQSSTGPAQIYTQFGAGPVPEPATWAMMLLGFGGVGAATRSRRKVSGPVET